MVRVPRVLRRLSPLAKTSLVLYGAGSLMLVASASVTDETRSPAWLLLTLAAASAAFAATVVVLGDRFTPLIAAVMISCNSAAIVLLCFTTDSPLGMVSNGTVYVVVGIYMIWFMPRNAARPLLAAGLGSYLAVVFYRDLPGVPFIAVTTAIQCVVAAEVMLRVRDRAETLATTDPLTGALNRRAVIDAAEIELGRFERQRRPFSIVTIDLDGLKELNDSQGHLAGDEMLRNLTRSWKRNLRPKDLLARIGGDEFVILLPSSTQADARRLLDKLRLDAPIGWSAGLAWAKPGDTFEAMLGRADERLYRQKSQQKADQETQQRRDAD